MSFFLFPQCLFYWHKCWTCELSLISSCNNANTINHISTKVNRNIFEKREIIIIFFVHKYYSIDETVMHTNKFMRMFNLKWNSCHLQKTYFWLVITLGCVSFYSRSVYFIDINAGRASLHWYPLVYRVIKCSIYKKLQMLLL